jgi:pyrroloquinoline quinone biosynthesis protein B
MLSTFTLRLWVLLWAFLGSIVPLRAQEIYVLGTAQDAGYPQLACERACCLRTEADPTARRFVVALAVVDTTAGRWYLYKATPDIDK